MTTTITLETLRAAADRLGAAADISKHLAADLQTGFRIKIKHKLSGPAIARLARMALQLAQRDREGKRGVLARLGLSLALASALALAQGDGGMRQQHEDEEKLALQWHGGGPLEEHHDSQPCAGAKHRIAPLSAVCSGDGRLLLPRIIHAVINR